MPPKVEEDPLKVEMDIATKSRSYLRTKITKQLNIIAQTFDSLNNAAKSNFISKLKSFQTELSTHNEKLFGLHYKVNGEDDLDDFVRVNEEYDDRIVASIEWLQEATVVPANHLPNQIGNPGNKLKLPTVPLPEFKNAKGDDLQKFLQAFEFMMNKHNPTPYENFLYLRHQLSGNPRTIIDSINARDQTYDVAKGLLIEAFDNKANSKTIAIQRLTQLSLEPGADPYKYIGDLRTTLDNIKSKEISADDFAQFFVWKSLNPKFQNHLISITNSSLPTLDQIRDNIFEGVNRYNRELNLAKPTTPKTQHTTSQAVEVNPANKGKVFCPLCSNDGKSKDHRLKECPIYQDPSSKVRKLQQIKGCVLCGFGNHVKDSCQFRSQCTKCQGKHMSFLCDRRSTVQPNRSRTTNLVAINREEDDVDSSNEEVQEVVTSAVTACPAAVAEEMILPTFTATLPNGENIRVFRDTGSMKNFISQSVLHQLNAKVVKKVDLVIQGFNSNNRVKTQVVEVPLTIAEQTYKVNAIVLKQINTKFTVPNLRLVTEQFIERGHILADKQYHPETKTIKNIEMVLGSESEHILPMRTVVFADSDSPSVYLDTPAGAMLTGNVHQMLANINGLSLKESDVNFTELETSLYACGTIESVGEQIVCEPPPIDDMKTYYENIFQIGEEDLDSFSESDTKIVNFVLENSTRDVDGRLVMPLVWNVKNSHMLSNNYHLARQILKSSLKKMSTNTEKLKLYNDVFLEQRQLGIIERVDNLDQFMEENPNHSFLAHMPIFKLDKDTSKCRVVFLSNLAEKQREGILGISHNQAMLPGPCLNSSMSTATMYLRFDKYLIIFDIVKAFLNIGLKAEDQARLMFLWYKDVEKGDFSIVAYKSLRLCFGLRPSPTLLMLGLYKILIQDQDEDDRVNELKRLVYHIMYMDNGGFTTNNETELTWAYETLKEVFGKYQILLQQFHTNSQHTQNEIDQQNQLEDSTEMVKVFGMYWSKGKDTLCPVVPRLNESADTRRKILRSINSVYDIFNVYLPLLLRAKLFIQKLLTSKDLEWDATLDESSLKEWINICRQVNSAETIEIPRSVGDRSSNYSLVAYTDASGVACGVVIYLLDHSNQKISFLTCKAKLLDSSLQRKSIPTLECFALCLGVEEVVKIKKCLTGEKVMCSIKINELFILSDSQVCLHWLHLYSVTFDKLPHLSVLVKNRLRRIDEITREHSITFSHVSGAQNPADLCTRPCSYKTLMKTSFHTGPNNLPENINGSDLTIKLPNVQVKASEEVHAGKTLVNTVPQGPSASATGSPSHEGVTRDGELTLRREGGGSLLACVGESGEPETVETTQLVEGEQKHGVLSIHTFSSWKRAVRVTKIVLSYINKLKIRIKERLRKNLGVIEDESKLHLLAIKAIVREAQLVSFRDCVKFLSSKKHSKICPELITKLNLILDQDNILRVKSKFGDRASPANPILLPKESHVTQLIITHYHIESNHAGVYSVLRELRKQFYILSYFSVTKNVLKACVSCKRFNEPCIRVNQSSYREFRCNPENVPFRNIMVDHIGPYQIKVGDTNAKVWILIITCLYTRAINLKVCNDLTTKEFINALQLHIFEFGVFSLCISDLGSQLVAGANLVQTFLSEPETHSFFQENGMKALKFQNYPKGNSSLGSLVEILVKQVKYLISKTIKNSVLSGKEFEFIVAKAVSIINKRPIAFKESLRDVPLAELPEVITPEILLRGYDTPSLNIIPDLQSSQDDDSGESYSPAPLRETYSKLRKIRERLMELYHHEFLGNLIHQAVDKPNRYKPMLHKNLEPGDIVLLAEKLSKRSVFPMARVVSVETNEAGEVTAARVFKGSTRETVYRHVTSLIPLLQTDSAVRSSEPTVPDANQPTRGKSQTAAESPPPSETPPRSVRLSREAARSKISAWRAENLI